MHSDLSSPCIRVTTYLSALSIGEAVVYDGHVYVSPSRVSKEFNSDVGRFTDTLYPGEVGCYWAMLNYQFLVLSCFYNTIYGDYPWNRIYSRYLYFLDGLDT